MAAGLSAALVVGLLPAAVLATAQPASAEPVASDGEPYDPSVADPSAEALALARAAETGEQVEVESLRSETSEVFASPEGELVAYEYLRPVWARVDGEWQPVDTNLELTAEGLVAPKSATAQMVFSGGGSDSLVQLERSGRELALEWPGQLPTPDLIGDTAIYHDVLPDVDLQVQAHPDGFSQLIVVNSAEAASNPSLERLRLGIDSSGVVMRLTEGGGIEAREANGDTAVFEAPPPLMWDSSVGGGDDAEARLAAAEEDEAAVGPPGAGESGNLGHVGTELTVERDALILTPDEEILRGEDTVYPVYIDPQWHSPRSTAWTMVSRYWANSPQWKFNGDANAGMGYCGWANCMPQDLKRLMYRIPTSKYAGTQILSAEFSVRNVHSASCTAQPVELWRTKDIDAKTTWNTQNSSGFWIKRLETSSFSYGHQGCAARDAEFDVKSAVQEAADKSWSTMTFGLKAENESAALSWKRFSDKAHLRVSYNRAPNQIKPSQLAMEYGGVCKPSGNEAHARTLGKIYANNITDPDGDRVAVEFRARWDAGDGRGNVVRWESGRLSSKASGSGFSVKLPTNLPQNREIQWSARSHDGKAYSPWSTSGSGGHHCHFMYNTSVPQGPAIYSSFYPESDDDNPLNPWYRGTGHYGDFRITARDSDVNRYWYGVNADPLQRNEITTTNGAPRVASVVPDQPGLHFITARAIDRAGNMSEITTYPILVDSGAPPKVTWSMNDAPGAAEAAPTPGTRWGTLHGGTTLGVDGTVGTAIRLDGASGYVSAPGPVIETARAFTVSAWVKLDRRPDQAAIVATQTGVHRPGFELYYSAVQDRWAFNQYRADEPGAATARALARDVEVRVGQWTHLVGSYIPSAGELRIYVDGQLAGTTPYTEAWHSRGNLQIGVGEYSGERMSWFPGVIDEVQVFDLGASTAHVSTLYRKERLRLPNGRPAVALVEFDEDEGVRRVSAAAEVLPATYHGGVQPGVPAVHGDGLWLNGTDGYARTSTAMLHTGRNFAVSSWVKLDHRPTSAGVIATQVGSYAPGFELYYSAGYDRWVFNQYSENSANGTPIRAMQPAGTQAKIGEWVHLVGVHDQFTKTLKLYVDGELAGTAPLPNARHADQHVQIGAGQLNGRNRTFFPGVIDDVRLYDRILTDYEVRQIYHQAPVVQARWQFGELGTNPVSTPDSSGFGHDLYLWGGAGLSPGFVDSTSMYVDGGGGYAYSADVPVDTSISFTTAGFVRAAAPPSGPASFMSVTGRRESAFAVNFVPDAESGEGWGRWEATLADGDDDKASITQFGHQRLYDVREWHHIAFVYDGLTAQARLYVNGELEEITCLDEEGDTCTSTTSWVENVFPFPADTNLHLGRSLSGGVWNRPSWPGAMDDVWVIQGVLEQEQIRQLSLGKPDMPTAVPPPAEQAE
ncbi:LamG-like jellyroll fold domain-containing protein [Streptomyces sp. XC 2026]|uniref:LamG-like jellyroll fold domain-containing protein n=1 Tax=Streptomyces sp. XC 2026 TaxID=2782004 RepID=UPI001F343B1B|nr:LamG-like jellyroll fold domain-containing protein [Streptomyces sp. XC 2026]